MSMWEEEKMQNDKVRNRKKGERLDTDHIGDERKDSDPEDKHDGKLMDRLLHGNDQGVDNGTSEWTATEKKH